MPITAAHTFTQVIGLPVAKIQAASVVSDSVYVFNSFADDEELSKFTLQDKLVVCRPKTFPPDRGCQAGGGRNTVKIDGTLNVSVWLRLWVDQEVYDNSWLTNSTLGMAPMIDGVVNALEQYMPTDSAGNYYFIQPMRLLSPGWNFPMKRIGQWGKIDSNWSMVFWMTMT